MKKFSEKDIVFNFEGINIRQENLTDKWVALLRYICHGELKRSLLLDCIN